MTIFRYIVSPLAGIATVLLMLEFVVGLLAGPLPLGAASVGGMAPFYLVAVVGGVAVAFVAPRYQVAIATLTGLLVPALAYWAALFTEKWSHLDPMAFEVMWTLGVPVAFAIGAVAFCLVQSQRKSPI